MKGFVLEQGYAPFPVAAGGRLMLRHKSQQPCFILAYRNGSAFQHGFSNWSTLLKPARFPTWVTFELKLLNNKQALSDLIKNINEYVHRSKISKDKIVGMGHRYAWFFINPIEGYQLYISLFRKPKALPNTLPMKRGLSTYIDNDSSLIALAEQKFGDR